MRLIDADRLKKVINDIMPELSEVLLAIDDQPDIYELIRDDEEADPIFNYKNKRFCPKCATSLRGPYCYVCGRKYKWEIVKRKKK